MSHESNTPPGESGQFQDPLSNIAEAVTRRQGEARERIYRLAQQIHDAAGDTSEALQNQHATIDMAPRAAEAGRRTAVALAVAIAELAFEAGLLAANAEALAEVKS